MNLTINSYQLPAALGEEARTVYSNDREPSVPANLGGVVKAVLGLNSIVVMRPSGGSGHLVPQPDYSLGPVAQSGGSLQKAARGGSAETPAAAEDTTNGTGAPKGYTPQHFWNSSAYAYQALMNQGHCCNPLNNSSGHSPRESSIAIAAFGDVSFNDVNAFQAYFSNLAVYVDKILIDGSYTCGNHFARRGRALHYCKLRWKRRLRRQQVGGPVADREPMNASSPICRLFSRAGDPGCAGKFAEVNAAEWTFTSFAFRF